MTLTDARDLYHKLASELGMPKGWRLQFDRAKRRFGQCRYSTKTISLSEPLVRLNNAQEVESVIRHEIAHALVGPGHGHDHVWRRMAIKCGDNGHRCYGAEVSTPEKPWVGTCPRCEIRTERYKRGRLACKACCHAYNKGRFTEEFLFTWTHASAGQRERRG